MLLFRDEEHVDRWCRSREMERGAVISTEQAWQLAYRWFSTRLSPDWKRYTLDESQDLLESLGLTGPFWNLRG